MGYDSLVRRRRAIKKAYLNSPFHISAAAGNTASTKQTSRRKPLDHSVPLESIVTLDPIYFPPELYSSQQQNRSASRAAQAAYWEQHATQKKDDADLDFGRRLEMLAKKESVDQGGGGTGVIPGEEPEMSGDVDDQQNEHNGGLLEEEDDFFEDDLEDDPYQQFDDDEGYEDLDEDDGGHDAYY